MKDLTYIEKYRLRDSERSLYGCNGDAHNGIFKVFVDGRAFICIVSDGGGWDHVSVRLKSNKRLPTWNEMCAIKNIFFEPSECVVQYHPPESDYVNVNPWVLHLWRPTDGEIKRPPKEFV